MTSYAKSVLQPNEKVIIVGRLHWIVYGPAIFVLVLGFLLPFVVTDDYEFFATLGATLLLLYGFVLLIYAWFDRWITEFAVTTHRVIYKKGFVSRRTAEMNMDKVESVTVNQSILGRILDYGSIHVLGTGQGIEHLHRIASPLALRNAIVAR